MIEPRTCRHRIDFRCWHERIGLGRFGRVPRRRVL